MDKNAHFLDRADTRDIDAKCYSVRAVKDRITAARGTKLRCKGWRQEALLRMLDNTLENAERLKDLVVNAGFAKAARDWRSQVQDHRRMRLLLILSRDKGL